jgi:hypothetical protein
VEVALEMPNLLDTDYVIIDNQRNNFQSQIEILQVSVLISQEYWRRNEQALAKYR